MVVVEDLDIELVDLLVLLELDLGGNLTILEEQEEEIGQMVEHLN